MSTTTRVLYDLIARDNASRTFARVSGSAGSLESKLAKTSKAMTRTGTAMSRAITLPALAAAGASVKLAVDFQDSMQKINGLVGISRKQVGAWSNDILAMAKNLPQSPKELADAMFFVTSAGLRGKTALFALKASAKAAAAGLGDTKTVADAVTSAMNAYGSKVVSASKATDILTATVREGKASAASLAPVFGRIIPLAATMGVKFADVGASLAAMTRLGMNANEAATSTQSILTGLLKPSTTGAKALKAVGLSYGGIRAEIRDKGLFPALMDVNKAFHGNSTELAKVIPNTRALRGFLALTGKQADATSGIFSRMTKTTGATDKAFQSASKTAKFKFQSALSSLQVAGIKVGTKLLPVLAKLAGKAAGLIGWFGKLPAPVKSAAKALGIAAVAAGPLIVVLGKIINLGIEAKRVAKTLKLIAAATSPVTWAAAAVAGLGLLAYKMKDVKTGAQGYLGEMAKLNHASGLNVAGYQKLASAIAGASSQMRQQQVVMVKTGVAGGAGAAQQQAFTAAQQKAAATAVNLRAAFASLGAQYHLNLGDTKSLIVRSGELKDILAANGKLTPKVAGKIAEWAQKENHATGLTNVMSIAVGKLTTSMDKLAGKVLTLQGDQLGWQSALQQANEQLRSNSAGLKGNSANAIANKQAVLGSTEAAVAFAKQQLVSKSNLGAASKDIEKQIRFLRGLKGHTKFAKDEIKLLVGWLKQIKAERANIKVSGTGSWTVLPTGKRIPTPGGGAGAAAGMFISRGRPGVDDQHIMAQRGELVVPANIVASGAVDHLRGAIPGFAAGGVVGSYRDGIRGLRPWLGRQNAATLRAIEQATANAILGSLATASGPSGGDAKASLLLARRMFPWPSSQWPAFYALEMAEAGFNRFARNPSSGAYGIPQALPPTKMPFAAQAAGGSLAGAQLWWMFNYIAGRYGTPAAAWAHEAMFRWYGRGGTFRAGQLIGVGDRGPELISFGRPGRVYSPEQSAAITSPSVEVRVFVGDREITDIVRTEVTEHDRRLARRVRAGAGSQP